MDVFLCGGCRFFVGLASGLSQVAVSFGVPCVYVNWISNVLPPFSAKDLFIPKLFHSEAEGRLLSFEEMYDPENLYRNASYYLIGGDDRRFRDSDPADIRECVGEMLDRLDGRCVYTPGNLRQRERLDAVMRQFGHRGYCRMGGAFLHKYGRLLNGLRRKRRASGGGVGRHHRTLVPRLRLGTRCPAGSACRADKTRGRASRQCVPRRSLGTRANVGRRGRRGQSRLVRIPRRQIYSTRAARRSPVLAAAAALFRPPHDRPPDL